MEYGFDVYHVLLVLLGVGIIGAYWLPRWFSGREPAASTLLIIAGLLVGLCVPALPRSLDPTLYPAFWEHAAEIAVIVSLFATGLRIDRLVTFKNALPTLMLLAVGMPICIFAVAFLGSWLAGMTLAGAILLGAVLAPTDPVLAGDVQVGPPLEGGEHPVRLTLTAEAGLNDGLAFPFVHLAILVGSAGFIASDLVSHWLLWDVAYRIAVGSAVGVGLGVLLAKVLFEFPVKNPLANSGAGVVALAGVLLSYGAAELLEGYGFIASFLAGLTLRRFEARHQFHRTLHSFTETVEHAFSALLLVALGAVIPVLWPATNWSHVAVGLALIFVVRPLAGFLSLLPTGMRGREGLVVAFYGVRGIGSIYYIAYAGGQLELVNEAELWSTVALTIFASTIIHGVTAGIAVEGVAGARQSPQGE